MLISRRGGKSGVYTTGDNEYFGSGQSVAKYLKFAYSANFGFNVSRSQISLEECAPDNMLVFDIDGLIMVRRHFKSAQVLDDKIIAEWSPFKGIDVKTTVIPTDEGHIREHEIVSEYDCTAYDAGFAVCGNRKCEVTGEGEIIVINAAPNTNIRYPKTVIPMVKYQIKKGNNKIRTVIKDYLGEAK